MIARLLMCVLVLPVLAGGCVELGFILQEGISGGTTGGSGSGEVDGDNSAPGSDAVADVPVVRLGVSNPSPLVGEEVLFTCAVFDGSAASVTFAFMALTELV